MTASAGESLDALELASLELEINKLNLDSETDTSTKEYWHLKKQSIESNSFRLGLSQISVSTFLKNEITTLLQFSRQ